MTRYINYITLYTPKLLGHVLGEISKGSCEQLDSFSEISVSPRDVNSYDTGSPSKFALRQALVPSLTNTHVTCTAEGQGQVLVGLGSKNEA